MPDYQRSMPTPNGPDVPANTGPPGWGAALATSTVMFISLLLIYLLLRPPLYDYDGYVYRLQAL